MASLSVTGVCLVVFAIHVLGQIQNGPSDVTVAVGSNAEMECELSTSSDDNWHEYISNSSGNLIIRCLDGFISDPDKYEIVGDCNLRVKLVDYSDGGEYGCKDTSLPDALKARLIVLGAQDLSVPALAEGQPAFFECSAQWSGSLNLPITQRPRMDLKIERKLIQGQQSYLEPGHPGLPGQLIWKLRVNVHYIPFEEDHRDEIECEMSTEPPSFTLTLTKILDVKFGVRRLKIGNNDEIYYVGEDITCSANGNPEPTYTWTDELYNGTKVISGSVLHVEKHTMPEGPNEYTCQATNFVQDTHTIDRTIQFNVSYDSNEAHMTVAHVGVFGLPTCINILLFYLI